MTRTLGRLAFFFLLSLTLVACSKGGPPGTEEGAKQLLEAFLKPDADHAALSKALRPTSADYAAVYGKEMGEKLEKMYAAPWDAGQLVVKPNEGQTELKLFKATSEELKSGAENAKEFPGGYKKVAESLQGGQTLYRFKFVKPGADSGMAFDGLVHVNGHWVIMPKPWRALSE